MLNDFVLYAMLTGAVIFGVTWLCFKDRGISWAVTGVLGLCIIFFVFPGPEHAKTLGDVAMNITLAIQKLVYLVGLAIGAVLVSLVCKERHER